MVTVIYLKPASHTWIQKDYNTGILKGFVIRIFGLMPQCRALLETPEVTLDAQHHTEIKDQVPTALLFY